LSQLEAVMSYVHFFIPSGQLPLTQCLPLPGGRQLVHSSPFLTRFPAFSPFPTFYDDTLRPVPMRWVMQVLFVLAAGTGGFLPLVFQPYSR
jgi:hypothetical protein